MCRRSLRSQGLGAPALAVVRPLTNRQSGAGEAGWGLQFSHLQKGGSSQMRHPGMG